MDKLDLILEKLNSIEEKIENLSSQSPQIITPIVKEDALIGRMNPYTSLSKTLEVDEEKLKSFIRLEDQDFHLKFNLEVNQIETALIIMIIRFHAFGFEYISSHDLAKKLKIYKMYDKHLGRTLGKYKKLIVKTGIRSGLKYELSPEGQLQANALLKKIIN